MRSAIAWSYDLLPPENQTLFRDLCGFEQLLASGAEAKFRERHANVFLRLTERAEQDLTGPDERVWLEALEADTGILRAALDWSLDPDVEAALRLSAALWLFWYRTGRVAEGEEWLGRALAKDQAASVEARGKALFVWGALAGARGDFQTAVERLEQALPLCAVGGDPAAAVAPLERAHGLCAYAATPMARTAPCVMKTSLVAGPAPVRKI